jgi:hypothetical protein
MYTPIANGLEENVLAVNFDVSWLSGCVQVIVLKRFKFFTFPGRRKGPTVAFQ